ncbi:prepilin-type N-terminal cleavage/methylation domain-containing protein [Pseudomonas sp. Z5-35]|uniref:PulJ/GspJ family protein n=1 Tax=unclassified Pseudomonas TaxID=196821 RepID=UPI003DA8B80E
MDRQKGFTLIEVMVAIMLMTIVSLIAWRGLDGVTRADAHLQDSVEQHAQLMRALNQLQRDFALRATTELAEPKAPDDPSVTRRPAPAAISIRSSDSDPLQLELIRATAAQDGSVQRVKWWVDNGTLFRAAGAARSRYPLPAPKEGVAVLSELERVDVRVWRADRGWSHLTGSKEENPAGLEISFNRRTAQGTEQYRQVLAPLE